MLYIQYYIKTVHFWLKYNGFATVRKTTKLIEGGHRGFQDYRHTSTFFNVCLKIQKVVTFYVFLPCFVRFLELWSHCYTNGSRWRPSDCQRSCGRNFELNSMNLCTVVWGRKTIEFVRGSNLIMSSPILPQFFTNFYRNAFSMGWSKHCTIDPVDRLWWLILFHCILLYFSLFYHVFYRITVISWSALAVLSRYCQILLLLLLIPHTTRRPSIAARGALLKNGITDSRGLERVSHGWLTIFMAG